MWDFLKKKNSVGVSSGKILNEREIQEKLYGKYRVPQKNKIEANTKESHRFFSGEANSGIAQLEADQATESPVSEPIENSKKASITAASSSTNYARYATQAAQGSNSPVAYLAILKSKRFWKILGLLLVLSVGTLILQKLWMQLSEFRSQAKSTQTDNQFSVSDSAIPVVSSTKKQDVSATVASSESALLETLRNDAASHVPLREPIETTKSENLNESIENPFSVQVCTYRLESDAQRLTERLQTENFSAFYQPSASRRDRNPKFYVVYVSREATYQDAQLALNKFKQSSISKEFPDAYIRKL